MYCSYYLAITFISNVVNVPIRTSAFGLGIIVTKVHAHTRTMKRIQTVFSSVGAHRLLLSITELLLLHSD